MTSARPNSITFPPFLLDLRGGCLSRAGETIPLRPKTWAVLVHLAQRQGVLVTKDELLDGVWPGIAVTPDTLTKSIGELRLALGDDARTPRFIETVHRRGFRFLAPTHPADTGAGIATEDRHTGVGCFVGRTAELDFLDGLLAKAHTGQRQMVFVTGPAGVGKSTLVDVFVNSAAAHATTRVGRGSCIEQHGSREAYMPVLEGLESLARQAQTDKVARLLRAVAPTWLSQMPWLIAHGADGERPPPQAIRAERMLRECATLIDALANDLTVVLVLEDLHWSDPSTVELLSFLGQRREPARLLVVATYRPADAAVREHVLPQAVRTLQLRRQCVELFVHELSVDEVDHYLERRFPGARFPPPLARVIHENTDGNPLFVTATVELLLTRGWILETDPGWALSVPIEELNIEIPDDARRMIESALEALLPADCDLLEAASVYGVAFAPQAIAAALGGDTADVEARCESLARANRFLRAAGSAEWPDGSVARRYAFVHELYRRAVYTGIPDGQRLRLHQRIGKAIEQAHGEHASDQAAELAAHFEKSRDYPRAIGYLAAAAQRARRRFADREALDYLEHALALTERLASEDARLQQELDLRVALLPVLADLHGFASEAMRDTCARTQELCTKVGNPEQRFQTLYALFHLHAAGADAAAAANVEIQLAHLAQESGAPRHRVLSDTVIIRNAIFRGHFAEGNRLAAERLFAPHLDEVTYVHVGYGVDPWMAATQHHGLALWMLGQTERGRSTIHTAVTAARERGSPFTQTATLWFACLLEVLSRNAAAAIELADQVVALSAEHGFVYWNAMAFALRGRALVEAGDVRGGMADIDHGWAALEATGARLFSTYILAFRAEAHLRLGAFDAGLTAIDHALALADTTLDRSYRPELWRLKGELLAAAVAVKSQGQRDRKAAAIDSARQWSEVQRCLQRALALARESEAKSLELRAATSLARAWQQRGRGGDARAVLSNICAWFEDSTGNGTETADLRNARALLARLQTSSTRGPRPDTRTVASRVR